LFVVIKGIADINQEPVLDDLLNWKIKIARGHMGQDDAELTVGERNIVVQIS
jgi:hypothetical protein